MHTNAEEIANLIVSGGLSTLKEGILLLRDKQSKKASPYVERWASLHGNLLCLRRTESKASEPCEIAILERCVIETGYCDNQNAMRLRYVNANDEPLEIAARNATEFEDWCDLLQNSSYRLHKDAAQQLENAKDALRINDRRQRASCLQRNSMASIGVNESAYELFLECANLPISPAQRWGFVDNSTSTWIASYCEVETLTPPNKEWTPVAQTELSRDGDPNPTFPRAVFVPREGVTEATRVRLRIWLLADHETERASEHGVAVFLLADLANSASRSLLLTLMSASSQEKRPSSISVSLMVTDNSLLDVFAIDSAYRSSTASTVIGTSTLRRTAAGDVQRRLQDDLVILCNDVQVSVCRFRSAAPVYAPDFAGARPQTREDVQDAVRHNPLVDAMSTSSNRAISLASGSPQLSRPQPVVPSSSTRTMHIDFIELLGESRLCVAVPFAFFDCLVDAENNELERMLSLHFPLAADEEERIQMLKSEKCALHTSVIAHHSDVLGLETLRLNNVASSRTFKPSRLKADATLEPLPTNLHVHRTFIARESSQVATTIDSGRVFDIITVGAFAAHVQRFKSGGLITLLESEQLRCCRKPLADLWMRAIANHFSQPYGVDTRGEHKETRALSTDSELEEEASVVIASRRATTAPISTLQSPTAVPKRPPRFTGTSAHGRHHHDSLSGKKSNSIKNQSSAESDGASDWSGHVDDTGDEDMMSYSRWNPRWPIDLSLQRLETLSERLVDRALGILKELVTSCYSDTSRQSLQSLSSHADRLGACSQHAADLCDTLVALAARAVELCEAVTHSLQRGHFVDELSASGTIAFSKLTVIRSFVTQQLIIDRKSTSIEDAPEEDVRFHSKLEPLVAPSRAALTEMRTQFRDLIAYARLLHVAQNVEMHKTLRLRSDVIMSQALTALLTGVATRLRACTVIPEVGRPKTSDSVFSDDGLRFLQQLGAMNGLLLCTFEGLLSCFGDEKGMLEDHFAAVRRLSQVVLIQLRSSDHVEWPPQDPLTKFVRLAAGVLGGDSNGISIVPHITGTREQLEVQLPVPEAFFRALPAHMRAASFRIRPFCVLLNIGINEMQTMAEIKGRLGKGGRLGEVALQNHINDHALKRLRRFHSCFITACSKRLPISADFEAVVSRSSDALKRLTERVQYSASKSGKHVEVLQFGSELSRALNGIRFTSCKSAKDRTAMSVTLEQTAIMMERYGLDTTAMRSTLDYLRAQGLRRRNCLKNVDTDRFAFNRVQLLTFPELYRPPDGTYGATDT